ncbi:uncharacterized protein [Littorina saxatilis]|uniref:Uncharacterized protein n=1 Tax=Littorina saxatilis TaxID=31220 RepID=A0AAN9AXB8_9CAEN
MGQAIQLVSSHAWRQRTEASMDKTTESCETHGPSLMRSGEAAENCWAHFHDAIVKGKLTHCHDLLTSSTCSTNQCLGTLTPAQRLQHLDAIAFSKLRTTSLHMAALYRRPDFVKLLLEHGCMATVMDGFGRVPAAVLLEHWPRVSFPTTTSTTTNTTTTRFPNREDRAHNSDTLLQLWAGRDPCPQSRPALVGNEAGRDMELFRQQVSTWRARSALCLKLLLDHGLQLNDVADRRRASTLLHIAARHDLVDVIEMVVRSGNQESRAAVGAGHMLEVCENCKAAEEGVEDPQQDTTPPIPGQAPGSRTLPGRVKRAVVRHVRSAMDRSHDCMSGWRWSQSKKNGLSTRQPKKAASDTSLEQTRNRESDGSSALGESHSMEREKLTATGQPGPSTSSSALEGNSEKDSTLGREGSSRRDSARIRRRGASERRSGGTGDRGSAGIVEGGRRLDTGRGRERETKRGFAGGCKEGNTTCFVQGKDNGYRQNNERGCKKVSNADCRQDNERGCKKVCNTDCRHDIRKGCRQGDAGCGQDICRRRRQDSDRGCRQDDTGGRTQVSSDRACRQDSDRGYRSCRNSTASSSGARQGSGETRFPVDLEVRNGTAKTPLAVAVDRGSLHAAHCLLSHGANVFTVDFYGRSLLHYLSERDVSFDLFLRDVVRQGVDVHNTDNGGNTALHVAAYMGNVSKVRFLLGVGASPDRTNMAGKTPLYLAFLRRDPSAREIILLFLLSSLAVRTRDKLDRLPLLLQHEHNADSQEALEQLESTCDTLLRRCVVSVRRALGLSRLLDMSELCPLPCPVFVQRAIYGEEERRFVEMLNI